MMTDHDNENRGRTEELEKTPMCALAEEEEVSSSSQQKDKDEVHKSDKLVPIKLKFKRMREDKTKTKNKKKKTSIHSKAGLIFPVTRINRKLKNRIGKMRVGVSAGVVISAVAQYLCKEVLDISATNVKNDRRKHIKSNDLYRAIKNDEDINDAFGINLFMPNIAPIY